jgi:hypothetical protein
MRFLDGMTNWTLRKLKGLTVNQASNEAPTKWNIIELQIVHYNLYESN